jgi:hypothetical protein
MKASRQSTVLEQLGAFESLATTILLRGVVLLIALGLFVLFANRTRRAYKRYRHSRRRHRIGAVVGNAFGLVLSAGLAVLAVIYRV